MRSEKTGRLCAGVLLLMAVLIAPLYPAEIMKFSELEKGMTGVGRTIFKGSQIEEFDFEIMGFLRNFLPGKNLIIVRLRSEILEGGGLLAGMSGSPLYVDGRLIGAAAYGLTGFPREPIAGVTPIEDILETAEYDDIKVNIDLSELKFRFDQENAVNINRLVQQILVSRSDISSLSKEIVPIKLLAHTRGLHPQSLFTLTSLFAPVQSLPVTGDPQPQPDLGTLFKLSAADAVSVPLIRGDLEYSASGTVTYVDGEKLYMFGHPFFNLGTVDLPIHKAEVISLLHSYSQSSKMVETTHPVGSVLQDRMSAVYGKLGKTPDMIPLTIVLKNQDKKLEMEMVNHPLLTPSVTGIALSSTFSSLFKDIGFQSIDVRGRIYLRDQPDVILDNLYSGLDSINEFSSMMLAINFFLMNNNDRHVDIQKMNFELETSEIIRTADIKKVLINKHLFTENEPINLKVFYRKANGPQMKEEISFRTPNIGSGKTFYLLIGGREAISDFDSKNIKVSYFPDKLKYLIRAINNLRKNNRIYFKVFIPRQGIYIDGHEYSGMPDTEQRLFQNHNIDFRKNVVRYSTITEYQLPVPFVMKGRQIIMLKTKER